MAKKLGGIVARRHESVSIIMARINQHKRGVMIINNRSIVKKAAKQAMAA